jgi:hypothetical protein
LIPSAAAVSPQVSVIEHMVQRERQYREVVSCKHEDRTTQLEPQILPSDSCTITPHANLFLSPVSNSKFSMCRQLSSVIFEISLWSERYLRQHVLSPSIRPRFGNRHMSIDVFDSTVGYCTLATGLSIFRFSSFSCVSLFCLEEQSRIIRNALT